MFRIRFNATSTAASSERSNGTFCEMFAFSYEDEVKQRDRMWA